MRQCPDCGVPLVPREVDRMIWRDFESDGSKHAIEHTPKRCHTTVVAKLSAVIAERERWENVHEDKWSADIQAAFPTRSGSHDEYGMAMEMVGNRYGKHELVALVNWLLVRAKKAEKGRP